MTICLPICHIARSARFSPEPKNSHKLKREQDQFCKVRFYQSSKLKFVQLDFNFNMDQVHKYGHCTGSTCDKIQMKVGGWQCIFSQLWVTPYLHILYDECFCLVMKNIARMMKVGTTKMMIAWSHVFGGPWGWCSVYIRASWRNTMFLCQMFGYRTMFQI